MERKCYVCKLVKNIEEFVKDKNKKEGRRYACKECMWALNMRGYLKRHGATTVDLQELLEMKKIKICAICNCTNNLRIDHDHKTGKLRGVLCRNCNVALGMFADSIEALEKARNYLLDANNS